MESFVAKNAPGFNTLAEHAGQRVEALEGGTAAPAVASSHAAQVTVRQGGAPSRRISHDIDATRPGTFPNGRSQKSPRFEIQLKHEDADNIGSESRSRTMSTASRVSLSDLTPPKDMVSMRALRLMSNDAAYRFRDYALALLDIARGTHPSTAANKGGLELYAIRHMAARLPEYVRAYNAKLFACYRAQEEKIASKIEDGAAGELTPIQNGSGNAGAWNTAPVYPLRVYKAGEDQLHSLGISSVWELVDMVNHRLLESGRLPISVGDFPTNKKNFERLVKRWAGVLENRNP